MGVLGDIPIAARHPKAFYENSLSGLGNSLQGRFRGRVEVGEYSFHSLSQAPSEGAVLLLHCHDCL